MNTGRQLNIWGQIIGVIWVIGGFSSIGLLFEAGAIWGVLGVIGLPLISVGLYRVLRHAELFSNALPSASNNQMPPIDARTPVPDIKPRLTVLGRLIALLILVPPQLVLPFISFDLPVNAGVVQIIMLVLSLVMIEFGLIRIPALCERSITPPPAPDSELDYGLYVPALPTQRISLRRQLVIALVLVAFVLAQVLWLWLS